MRYKLLLKVDMNVPKEWKKYLIRGKTEDTLVAYYINFKIETAKINQTETNNLHQWWTEGQLHQSDQRWGCGYFRATGWSEYSASVAENGTIQSFLFFV